MNNTRSELSIRGMEGCILYSLLLNVNVLIVLMNRLILFYGQSTIEKKCSILNLEGLHLLSTALVHFIKLSSMDN